MNATQVLLLQGGRVQVRYRDGHLTGKVVNVAGDEENVYVTVLMDSDGKMRTFLVDYVEPEEPLLSLARAGREA